MPVIKLSAFTGERPLIIPRLLPETAGKAASNVRMDDGGLTPINKAVLTGDTALANAKTIYRHQGTWYSWPTVVNAAPGPVASERLYFTGSGVPKVKVSGVDYPLALAPPAGALTPTVTGTGSGDVISRTYVYTWVTGFGEESAPSPTSALVNWQPGQTMTLSGFAAPPAGRNITKQRIYRSQTGSSGTYLYFIAERAASASNFVDTVPVNGFNEALPSADYNPPPDSLTGLISMPNGMMAAFSGRDVYFSQPWQPHAWPQKYIMTVDSDIVALGSIGSVLVVMTEANPYLMTGSTPDTMQSQKLELNLPCINASAVVDLGFAICYPSNDGLAVVRADGSISMATGQLFRRDQWQALSPKTAVAGQHGGLYLFFYDTTNAKGDRVFGSLFINVDGTPFLLRSAVRASALFFSIEDSGLYFVTDGDIKIYRFDSPDGAPETLYWRSKEYWLNEPVNFGRILIDEGPVSDDEAARQAEAAAIKAANAALYAANQLLSSLNATVINALALNGDTMAPIPEYGQVTVGVYADGDLIATISQTGVVKALPAKRKARRWEIDVSGNIQVQQIIMAGTMEELRSAQ